MLWLPARVTSQRQQAPPTFSASSELVVLHVTVRDRRGAYVGGLTQDAFNVIEDGRAQTVRLFTDTDTPATIGLLIDSSGSMYQHRALTIDGASAFAEASHPQDEIFALAFNEHVSAVLPAGAPFTSDSRVLRGALEHGISSRGRTALYDAISDGVDYLAPRQPRAQGPRGPQRRRRQRESYDHGRGRPEGAGVERGDLHDRAHRARFARRQSRAC